MIGQSKKMRNLLKRGRNILFPPVSDPDPATFAREQEAITAWQRSFAVFQPVIEGADILVVGPGSTALATALSTGMLSEVLPHSTSALEPARSPNGRTPGSPQTQDPSVELQDIEARSLDLILCTGLDQTVSVRELEPSIDRLYAAIRPGGEALIAASCFDPSTLDPRGPGYGCLTPSTWSMLFLRAGFEIVALRHWERPAHLSAAAARRLPFCSESEVMVGEIGLHLIRPWEASELEKVWSAANP